MSDKPVSFRLTKENQDKLKEIEGYIKTVSNRNATMNFIIQSYYEVVILPRRKIIEETKKNMTMYGISISDLQ